MGRDLLTFVKSCRQMDRMGIIPLCVYYRLYDYNMLALEPSPICHVFKYKPCLVPPSHSANGKKDQFIFVSL